MMLTHRNKSNKTESQLIVLTIIPIDIIKIILLSIYMSMIIPEVRNV